jgi:hypothetical protein
VEPPEICYNYTEFPTISKEILHKNPYLNWHLALPDPKVVISVDILLSLPQRFS